MRFEYPLLLHNGLTRCAAHLPNYLRNQVFKSTTGSSFTGGSVNLIVFKKWIVKILCSCFNFLADIIASEKIDYKRFKNVWRLTSKRDILVNEIKYEYPWIKVTKFMTTHYRILWKIKSRVSTSCSNKANDGAKFDYWGGRKTLLYFRIYGLVTWETIHVFWKEPVEGTNQRGCSFWPAVILAKHDVNRRLIDFF